MAYPTDRSSLPDAELNPLLNPLLAKNMGRWAEVYFNAVPEKREEAVQDLVRQLETEQAQREQSVVGTNQDSFPVPRFNRSAAFTDPSTQQDIEQSARNRNVIACATCGHETARDQRFCGMCGAKLSSTAPQEEPSAAPDMESRKREGEYEEQEYSSRSEYGDDSHRDSRPLFSQYNYDDDDRIRGMFQTEPQEPRSYRGIIAVVVAIIAVVLIYVAWHSGQAASALRRVEEGKTAVSEQPATPSNQSTPQSAGEAQQGAGASPASAQTNTAGNTPPNPAPQQPQTTTEPPRENPREPGRRPVTVAAATDKTTDATTGTTPDSGTQELAMAQRYLNGTNGQADRAEAAQWLWKAVAKRNLQATVELSDLYLRGEGVAKSCDQGRILLDAAAIRGSKEAGVRLQHLQAFGCQ